MKKYSPFQKSYNTILYSKKEFSATITLNRPHVHNALNLEMLQELGDALQKAQWDDDIAVIVVTDAHALYKRTVELLAQFFVGNDDRPRKRLALTVHTSAPEITEGIRAFKEKRPIDYKKLRRK